MADAGKSVPCFSKELRPIAALVEVNKAGNTVLLILNSSNCNSRCRHVRI
jgi:hypothetical protein